MKKCRHDYLHGFCQLSSVLIGKMLMRSNCKNCLRRVELPIILQLVC